MSDFCFLQLKTATESNSTLSRLNFQPAAMTRKNIEHIFSECISCVLSYLTFVSADVSYKKKVFSILRKLSQR